MTVEQRKPERAIRMRLEMSRQEYRERILANERKLAEERASSASGSDTREDS